MFKVALTLFVTALIISAVIIFFVMRRDKKRELEAQAKGNKKNYKEKE